MGIIWQHIFKTDIYSSLTKGNILNLSFYIDIFTSDYLTPLRIDKMMNVK